jgi:hypothetical protein
LLGFGIRLSSAIHICKPQKHGESHDLEKILPQDERMFTFGECFMRKWPFLTNTCRLVKGIFSTQKLPPTGSL